MPLRFAEGNGVVAVGRSCGERVSVIFVLRQADYSEGMLDREFQMIAIDRGMDLADLIVQMVKHVKLFMLPTETVSDGDEWGMGYGRRESGKAKSIHDEVECVDCHPKRQDDANACCYGGGKVVVKQCIKRCQ